MKCWGARSIAAAAFFLSCTAGPTRAVAEPTVEPSGSRPQLSLQEEFNQASDAFSRGDCKSALPIFENLSKDSRVRPGSISAGAISLRYGICLAARGKLDAGETAVRIGLPIMVKAGPDFSNDVADGESVLGQAAMLRWDHDAAVTHLALALERQSGTNRLSNLIRMAMVTSFDGGSLPITYAEEGLRIASAEAKPDKETLSQFETIMGRILLNQGDAKNALPHLRKALSLSGGLTGKISLSEAAMRGDLAQAELLNGHPDSARLYLAYTGAGRIAESPFAVATVMRPPECGSETGLRPEDFAVVEFAISDDGTILSAQTVYSRGNYAVATAFARAVSQWYWRPESIAKIPLFYRLLTRVELRCTNGGTNMPGVELPLWQRFAEWSSRNMPQVELAGVAPRNKIDRFRELASDRESKGDIVGLIATLGTWGYLDPRISSEVVANLDRAITLSTKAVIPDTVTNSLKVFQAMAESSLERRGDEHKLRFYPSKFQSLAAEPVIASDPLAHDTLLMLAVREAPARDDRGNITALLQSVAEDSRLANHHPLKQVALLQLANLSAQGRDFENAQKYFVRTGLTEQQCSLIGLAPALRHSGADGSDYPKEALQLGFEGWVKLEFDINANGTTGNARPIIAYPPFVFSDGATRMSRDMRYQASYRPEGGSACSANQETVKFSIQPN